MLESPDDHAIARRIERNWATSAAEFTRTLHSLHTRWDGEVTPLGGGYAILAGPGLYVNRAVGLGLDGPVDEQAFCLLEDASVRVGVHPEIEITPLSDPSVRERVATLGGMGVIPSARGHGFQRAMIDARVQLARLQGADLVTSSAVSQVSKNNLHACRFTRLYDQETWTRT